MLKRSAAEGKRLTCTVTRLIHFILGGGVQVQTDRSILSCDKVKGRPVRGGHSLWIITINYKYISVTEEQICYMITGLYSLLPHKGKQE